MGEVVKHLDLVTVWEGATLYFFWFNFPQQAGFDDILFAASYLQADNCCNFHGNNKLALKRLWSCSLCIYKHQLALMYMAALVLLLLLLLQVCLS